VDTSLVPIQIMRVMFLGLELRVLECHCPPKVGKVPLMRPKAHYSLFGLMAVLLSMPGLASADSLTGSVTINWLRPSASSITNTGAIDVGSSLACPGTSQICRGYNPTTSEIFSVGSSSITYNGSGYNPAATSLYPTLAFDGFSFTGLTFAGGRTLADFTLTTNMSGLTASDVTFTGSSIEIDLSGVQEDGTFTLGLVSNDPVPTPEPASLTLLAAGLIGFLYLTMQCKYERVRS